MLLVLAQHVSQLLFGAPTRRCVLCAISSSPTWFKPAKPFFTEFHTPPGQPLQTQEASEFKGAQGIMKRNGRFRASSSGSRDLEAAGKWGTRYVTWATWAVNLALGVAMRLLAPCAKRKKLRLVKRSIVMRKDRKGHRTRRVCLFCFWRCLHVFAIYLIVWLQEVWPHLLQIRLDA